MPSVISVLLREQLRIIKPITTKENVDKMRASQDKLGELRFMPLRSKVNLNDLKIGNAAACFITPNTDEPCSKDLVMLYLHGGAYVAGSIKYARCFASILSSYLNIPVLASEYRLAPENPYPAALIDAENAYKYLLEQGFFAQNIIVIGESAGGGLLLSLTMKLKSDSLPLPGKLIAVSPWTDLTFSGSSYIENQKRDPVLSRDQLSIFANMYYSDTDPTDPYVSPLFGDFTGFPPTLMFAGSDELLLDDARELQVKLASKGVPNELIIEDGMWHVYVLYGVPEAKRAMQKIKEFVIEDKLNTP